MADVSTLAVLLERLVLALRSLTIVIGVVVVVYAFGRFIAVPAVRAATEAAGIDDTLRLTLTKVTGAGFGLLGLYLALPLSGLATTPTTIAALSAGATIAIGFASRDILSNFVSGTILVVDPEFHVGDWIAWDDREGIIEDIGFRVTRVHTFDNELVTVPNSQLTQQAVTNPSSKDRRRIRHEFGVGYDDDVDDARALMLEAARDQDDILDRPAPTVHLVELADSYVGLEAFFWIADPARAEMVRIRSEYVQTVKERFEAADIEMPYPYRELTGSVGTWEAVPTESA
ncbi:MAG: mechanosensitive ion channel family protein [Halobacteriales archaeon]